MTRKTKGAKAPCAGNPADPRKLSEAKARAELALLPAFNAAAVVEAYAKETFSEQGVAELAVLLAASSREMEKGDMSRVEAMLFGQATALQTVFVSLARRASCQESLLQYETFLRLALKAQSQSRATLETLAAIKNPPVIYARQANVTTGPQQVNNGLPSRARKIETEQSKLSGGGRELLEDTQASQNESRVNPPVGAVDKVHRA